MPRVHHIKIWVFTTPPPAGLRFIAIYLLTPRPSEVFAFSAQFVTCPKVPWKEAEKLNKPGSAANCHISVLLNIWLHPTSGNCMARCDVPQFRRTMARRAINASKHGSPWKGTRRRKYMGGRERKMLKINKVKTNKKCSREKKSFVFVNVWTLWANSNGEEKSLPWGN